MQIVISLRKILIIACDTTQRAFVPNFKLFWAIKQSYGPKKLENFFLYYMGEWAGGDAFAHKHGYRNINAWRVSNFELP